MVKCKNSSSLGPISRNIICLTLGLLIGIRLTTFWYDLQEGDVDEFLADAVETTTTTTPSSSPSLQEYEQLSQQLFNNTRVLCWIMTSPKNHHHKAIHIRQTWGTRCNKLLFMSTERDEELPSVKLDDVEEGRHNLWNKTKKALKYIYDHHFDDAEWFLKADDDTYVIMENLRYFLYPYSPEIAIYFGAKFKPYIKQGYMSGGAGYVLSKEALRKFALEAYDNPLNCPKLFQSEDVQLGFCMENLNVIAGDSRDEQGYERFMPLAVRHLIPKDTSYWYQNYAYYPPKQNGSCCSPNAVSFHYIKPNEFYVLDYLIYTLRAFGVLGNFRHSLPEKLNGTEGVNITAR
ncbi:glycoprotein-N-acetylgalactosamine 3-beta-galactosyltransferase 1-like [Lucilia sericata]|uniref:glycoprotein-N-acetylgalactosamine 3-beta-galactosyltransferase 1-like n=1 Tax=Lucilia sericata TaxID=13632 RepID=UPI0018A83A14|nr:glycoprotein-N-acetylgalactosamine 3-beta-galactosyltransferase 1-like [Lucilia sericata]